MIIIYFLIFVLGLIVGSFLNCIIWRLEKKKNFLKGRSCCPYCKHKLSWQDLIPVLSFLILKGKCRYCGKKISIQYPLVEIITGLLFLLIFSQFSVSQFSILMIINICFLFSVLCFLVIIFVYDLKHFIIPDKVIFPAIGLIFFYNLFKILFSACGSFPFGKSGLIGLFGAAFGAAGFFLIIFLISRGKWIGFGDVKLGFLMGFLLGFPKIIPALFLAFFLGAVIGIGLIIAKKKTLKSEVPFGPFLVIGTFIGLFWGQQIVNWYLNLLLI